MKAYIKNGTLYIELPIIDPPKLSSTRRSKVIATSGGGRNTNITYKGKAVKISATAYIEKSK